MSVRSAVMTAPGEIGVQRFDVPSPEPGAVLLRVRLSGVCGTDKHTFRGETVQYAGTAHERRLAYPLICGHENVGVVEVTGGEVLAADGTALRNGDRSCRARTSRAAAAGTASTTSPGAHGADGGDTRCGGCAARPRHVVRRERRRLCVGPLGLCHVLKSRLVGCGELIAIDRFASRLEAAGALGDAHADRVRARRGRARGEGGGAHASRRGRGVRLLRRAGDIPDGATDGARRRRCRRVRGIGGERATSYAPSLELLAANQDRLPVERIVTHRLPLEAAGDALELAQRAESVKLVLDPLL